MPLLKSKAGGYVFVFSVFHGVRTSKYLRAPTVKAAAISRTVRKSRADCARRKILSSRVFVCFFMG